MSVKVPISVIILTYNEEANIEYALKSVYGWVSEIILVDSYSTDKTLEIARNYTDRICQHPFVHYSIQRNWALQNLAINQNWVLFIDADEETTTNFRDELSIKINQANQGGQTVAFTIRHTLFFLNKPLKYTNISVPHVRIVRKDKVLWQPGKGAMEQCIVNGKTGELKSRLLHNNRKELSDWIKKHDWYSTEEARHYFIGKKSNRTGFARKFEDKLPIVLRPFIKFSYVFFLRLGFLDGKAGFAYAFLHDFWFPFLTYLKLQEMKNESNPSKLQNS